MTHLEGLKDLILTKWLQNPGWVGENWDKLTDQYDANNYPKDYGRYTQSDHWKTFRANVIEERGKCEACDDTYEPDAYFVVHHHHYNSIGAEKVEDVALLCERCHIMVHGESSLPLNSFARRMVSGLAKEMGYELTKLSNGDTELADTPQNDRLTGSEIIRGHFKQRRDIMYEILNYASVIAKLARKNWVSDASFVEATELCTACFNQVESKPGERGRMIYYLTQSLWNDIMTIVHNY